MYINRTIKCLKRLQKRRIDENLRQLVLIRLYSLPLFLCYRWAMWSVSESVMHCITPFTVWAVSNNESNFLLEKDGININLETCQITFGLISQPFYGSLFSYLTITHVTSYLQYKIKFLSCGTSQPKPFFKLTSYLSDFPKTKIPFARLACLCLFSTRITNPSSSKDVHLSQRCNW